MSTLQVENALSIQSRDVTSSLRPCDIELQDGRPIVFLSRTLPETNGQTPLKIGLNAPKGNENVFQEHPFSGANR